MATTLAGIRARKSRWKAVLLETLDSVKQQLITMGALKIVLFGSLSAGEIHSGSDIDLVVVMPDSKDSKAWRGIVYDNVKRRAGCDFFVYSESSFAKASNTSMLLKRALSEGKVIYER